MICLQVNKFYNDKTNYFSLLLVLISFFFSHTIQLSLMILSKIIFNITITSTNRTLQGTLLYSIAISSSPLVLISTHLFSSLSTNCSGIFFDLSIIRLFMRSAIKKQSSIPLFFSITLFPFNLKDGLISLTSLEVLANYSQSPLI